MHSLDQPDSANNEDGGVVMPYNVKKRIAIVGGGIAGVETALTLARGLPNSRVTLISSRPTLCLLPDLVYVPLGMPPQQLDIPLGDPLDREGIELVEGIARRIDTSQKVIHHDHGTIAYDAMVLCTGTIAERSEGLRLRTLEDALTLRDTLASLDRDHPHSLVVRQMPSSNWMVPGYEFAMLLRAWLTGRGMTHSSVTVVSHDSSPLLMFNVDASDIVEAAMSELGVELLRGLPAERVESITGDINIDVGHLQAKRVAGFDPVAPDGFYRTRLDGSTSDGHYVVGDAADVPFKAAFATSWQARRVLLSLCGSLDALDDIIDGVPATHCEYQMDLVHRTLVVRIATASHMDHAFADPRAQVTVRSTPPDKLQGTFVKHVLIGDRQDLQVPRAFHDQLKRQLLGARPIAAG